MEIILIFLIILSGLLGGYTMNFQKTTLLVGKKLAPDNEFLPRGMQDAITPESQNIRNILFPISILAVLIIGFFITKWYFAILITLGTSIVVTPICQQFMPKPESKHYLDAIKKGLTKKLELYKRKNDTERIYAATSVLEDLNKLK
jgi:uncharacterized protein YneF (UPF0154 family)